MGKQWKQWQTLFWGLQNHCRWWLQHDIKRLLLLGRKAVTNLDSILKNRDIILPTKVHLVKAMVFLYHSYVWMWELDSKESWVPKNWCFFTVVLEKTLESPLDCKEIQPVHLIGNQSWVFIEGLMLKLKLQHFGHLMQRTDSSEKTLLLQKIEGRRRRGRQRMRWDGITNSRTWVWVSSRSWWCTGRPGMLQSMESQSRHNWATELTEHFENTKFI